jgi:alpha-mannosidase
VFNSLAWQRGGVVEVPVQMPSASPDGVTVLDSSNRVVPSQVLSHDAKTNTYQVLLHLQEIPSLGYAVLHVIAGKHKFQTGLKSSGTTIENAELRIAVDPHTGCITSLFDKKTNFETIVRGGCGNELQAFEDTPKKYDAWNIDPGTLDATPALLHEVESVKLVEQGPLRSTIRVAHKWKSSTFIQDITLYTGDDHAIITNDIDWHETHILLKASFPLAASSDKAAYEIPYGAIERRASRCPRCAGLTWATDSMGSAC